MSDSLVRVHVSKETKAKFRDVCAREGMGMETAIITFLQQIVDGVELPFLLEAKKKKLGMN